MKGNPSRAGATLGKLGAAKGGKARASVLSPTERSEQARQAVVARWRKVKGGEYQPPKREPKDGAERTDGPPPMKASTANQMPYSMFRGTIRMGNMNMECHVLSDVRRVLTQREVVRMISGGRESGGLAPYLRSNPLTVDMIAAGADVKFRIPGQPNPAHGYEATFLVDVCTRYLEAREQDLLSKNQLPLAVQAEIVLRACAKVGIIALIDEATGYQELRAKRALQLKLQAFIAEEMQEWARMFPDEFWLELARLEGIHYSPRSRPLRWGKYVMAFVYDALDKDIGKKLREINPNPHHRQNHHQWLKAFGREKLNNHLQRVIGTMQACTTMEEFKRKFDRIFRKMPLQLDFGFEDQLGGG